MSNLSEYVRSFGEYAFHQTRPQNVDSIREQGIQPDFADQADTSMIQEELERFESGDKFPFDRSKATYCHLDGKYILELRNDEFSDFAPEEVTIVVSIEDIPNPMYLADMSPLLDLVDIRHRGIQSVSYANSPDDVVERYYNSIVRVKSSEDIRSDQTERTHTELVVDGAIPPSAIVDICSE